MSRGAEPGEASGTKGLEFMAELNKAGNFVPVSAKSGTIAQGQTPVVAALGLQPAGHGVTALPGTRRSKS